MPERVTQIQQALIREHYLTGDANGKWDATTIAAMQKYQADHGWQTKLMPDRARSRVSASAPTIPRPSTPRVKLRCSALQSAAAHRQDCGLRRCLGRNQ